MTNGLKKYSLHGYTNSESYISGCGKLSSTWREGTERGCYSIVFQVVGRVPFSLPQFTSLPTPIEHGLEDIRDQFHLFSSEWSDYGNTVCSARSAYL